MHALGPEFIDVTWNAGGSSSQLTLEVCLLLIAKICSTAQSVYGIDTCMHLYPLINIF